MSRPHIWHTAEGWQRASCTSSTLLTGRLGYQDDQDLFGVVCEVPSHDGHRMRKLESRNRRSSAACEAGGAGTTRSSERVSAGYRHAGIGEALGAHATTKRAQKAMLDQCIPQRVKFTEEVGNCWSVHTTGGSCVMFGIRGKEQANQRLRLMGSLGGCGLRIRHAAGAATKKHTGGGGAHGAAGCDAAGLGPVFDAGIFVDSDN